MDNAEALVPVRKPGRRPQNSAKNAADRTRKRKLTLLEKRCVLGVSMLAIGRWLGVLLLGMSLAAESLRRALIDNERVTVWDVSAT